MTDKKPPGLKPNDKIQLIYEADSFYPTMLDLIRGAKESIHLQTYIFHDDSIGRQIIEALKSAAARGVKVYLLVDRLGSRALIHKVEAEFKTAGVHFRFFGKFRWLKFFKKEYYIGRRLHHKVLLVDQTKALISGINIGGDFMGWFDFAVYLEGACCHDVYLVCLRYWPYRIRARLKKEAEIFAPTGGIPARIINNDNLLRVQLINRSYRSYLKTARKDIFIISSYFFPGSLFIKKLASLQKSGVRVRILCPHFSDVPLIQKAAHHYYAALIKRGVEIYEWLPGVLHGKAAVIDGKILSLGSYNLNYTSHFTNIELNLEIHSESLAADFTQIVEKMMAGNVKKVAAQDLNQSLFNRINCFLAYHAVRLISFLHVFLSNHNKRMSLDEI